MELREATSTDIEAIRAVASASLSESYGHAVDDDVLSELVDRWYDATEVAADIASTGTVFPVAVESGDIVGFAESYVVDRRERVGEIDWLHVHPDHRGSGIGRQLLGYLEDRLRELDVDRIEGRVLVANEAGTRFYEREGYESVKTDEITVDRDVFRERVYAKQLTGDRPFGDSETKTYTDADGREVYVSFDESDRGSAAPFFVAYTDPDLEQRYGYLCGNCDGLDVAVDTMERVECQDCRNRRKPSRWDAAYL